MPPPNDAAHVGSQVMFLTNENDTFKNLRAGQKEHVQFGKNVDKKNEKSALFRAHQNEPFDHVANDHLGDNFFSLRNQDGSINAIGMDTPAGEDTDGGSSDGTSSQQAKTSLRWDDGSSLNADNTNYYVLPEPGQDSVVDGAIQLNRYGQHVPVSGSTSLTPGNLAATPLYGTYGVQKGDVGLITTADGRTTVGILGDFGPHAQIGEYSTSMLHDVAQTPTSSLAEGTVKLIVFPGSGASLLDENGHLKKMTPAELKNAMWKIAKARMAASSGGYVIMRGANTVVIGTGQKPAGFADPTCWNTSGAWHQYGSDTVSVEGKPFVRLGDFDSFRFQCVTGATSVQVYGQPTTKGTTAYPQMPLKSMPGWAQSIMEPRNAPSALKGLGVDANQGIPDNPLLSPYAAPVQDPPVNFGLQQAVGGNPDAGPFNVPFGLDAPTRSGTR